MPKDRQNMQYLINSINHALSTENWTVLDNEDHIRVEVKNDSVNKGNGKSKPLKSRMRSKIGGKKEGVIRTQQTHRRNYRII